MVFRPVRVLPRPVAGPDSLQLPLAPRRGYEGVVEDLVARGVPQARLRRLGVGHVAVLAAMVTHQDGGWVTPLQVQWWITAHAGLFWPIDTIKARMRDLRKPRWGGHVVERRRGFGQGLRAWTYHLVLAPGWGAPLAPPVTEGVPDGQEG